MYAFAISVIHSTLNSVPSCDFVWTHPFELRWAVYGVRVRCRLLRLIWKYAEMPEIVFLIFHRWILSILFFYRNLRLIEERESSPSLMNSLRFSSDHHISDNIIFPDPRSYQSPESRGRERERDGLSESYVCVMLIFSIFIQTLVGVIILLKSLSAWRRLPGQCWQRLYSLRFHQIIFPVCFIFGVLSFVARMKRFRSTLSTLAWI